MVRFIESKIAIFRVNQIELIEIFFTVNRTINNNNHERLDVKGDEVIRETRIPPIARLGKNATQRTTVALV